MVINNAYMKSPGTHLPMSKIYPAIDENLAGYIHSVVHGPPSHENINTTAVVCTEYNRFGVPFHSNCNIDADSVLLQEWTWDATTYYSVPVASLFAPMFVMYGIGNNNTRIVHVKDHAI